MSGSTLNTSGIVTSFSGSTWIVASARLPHTGTQFGFGGGGTSPRQNGTHFDEVLEPTEALRRADFLLNRELQPRVVVHVVNLEAGEALVLPCHAVVIRQEEADILLRAGPAEARAVAGFLVDVHHRLQHVQFRLEADAAQALIRGASLDRKNGLQRGGFKIPEVVRVRNQQAAKVLPQFGKLFRNLLAQCVSDITHGVLLVGRGLDATGFDSLVLE